MLSKIDRDCRGCNMHDMCSKSVSWYTHHGFLFLDAMMMPQVSLPQLTTVSKLRSKKFTYWVKLNWTLISQIDWISKFTLKSSTRPVGNHWNFPCRSDVAACQLADKITVDIIYTLILYISHHSCRQCKSEAGGKIMDIHSRLPDRDGIHWAVRQHQLLQACMEGGMLSLNSTWRIFIFCNTVYLPHMTFIYINAQC